MKAPLEFRIHGMDCADEVAILRREIEPLVESPDRLGFDILRGKMLIATGTPVITADQIVRAVGRTGMRAMNRLLGFASSVNVIGTRGCGKSPLTVSFPVTVTVNGMTSSTSASLSVSTSCCGVEPFVGENPMV